MLSTHRFVLFKGGDYDIEFLDVPAGSGFQFCSDIDLIAKLTCARAKFSEIAYRGRPSFFAPSNLFIKDAHSHFRLLSQQQNTFATTLDVEAQHIPKIEL
jgi:hypothetical protein